MTKPKRKRVPRCKECPPEAPRRPVTPPGPRCATHHRARLKREREGRQGGKLLARYGLTADDYRRLYEHQGGRCAICRWATGATRALSVDHDHRAGCGHPPEVGCRACVRGLVCRPCNDFLGRQRDATATVATAYWYLVEPPARAVLAA